MMFIEAGANLVFAVAPVPTACMLQAVMTAVMSAVAAINEISRILLSSGQDDGTASWMLCPHYLCKREAALCFAAQSGGDGDNAKFLGRERDVRRPVDRSGWRIERRRVWWPLEVKRPPRRAD
jgi:hypothetical protein